MAVHNAVTLLKKSDAVMGMMLRHFSQSAFDDGVPLDPAVQAEVVKLQADIKAQVLHIEKTGELEQKPHPSGDDRAPKGGRFGKGRGGGMNTADAEKLRKERVAREKAESELVI